MKAAARRYTPDGLTDRVGERVEDVKAAVVEGRAAMRRREMQLRAGLDGPGGRARVRLRPLNLAVGVQPAR